MLPENRRQAGNIIVGS